MFEYEKIDLNMHWSRLIRAAESRRFSCASVGPPIRKDDLMVKWSLELGVVLRPEARWLFSRSNGLSVSRGDKEAELAGQFHFPDVNTVLSEYRRVRETPDDRLALLDRVFPVFLSRYGEFLGFAPDGDDPSIYEISSSNNDPCLAFSTLSHALHVLALYYEQAENLLEPGVRELNLFRQCHEYVDSVAACHYWE